VKHESFETIKPWGCHGYRMYGHSNKVCTNGHGSFLKVEHPQSYLMKTTLNIQSVTVEHDAL